MTDCVIWPGEKTPEGYGLDRVRIDGRKVGEVAHRKAWKRAYGPIPTGLYVLHKCDNPGCVNLDHLFLGTQKDNIADMDAKGRRRPPSTHCKRGHPFEPGSFYTYDGVRRCKACQQIRSKKWLNKHKHSQL